MSGLFWENLRLLVETSEIVIDRPKGTPHPRYPQVIYPVDYGYLEGTISGDGAGIDVWRGSLQPAELQGVALTVDLSKRDAEIKILLGCTPAELTQIGAFLNSGNMKTVIYLQTPDES